MKKNKGLLNKREDLLSMIFGLGVVILIVFVIYRFVVDNKGNIAVPGLSTNNEESLLTIPGKVENISDNNNYYEVQKGDNLWQIAQSKLGNGNLWKQIAVENNIKDGRFIEVGQKLVLPQVTPTLVKSETISDGKGKDVLENYQVKFGDSLWKIAVVNFSDGYKWVQIWYLNKNIILDPNRLEIGMMIKLR